MWIIELLMIGLVVGLYGTMIGAGGGFLLVPILLLIYHFSPQHAIGTSLCVVFFNVLSGTFSYARQKRIDYHTGVRFALGTLPGAILGVFLAKYFSAKAFDTIFGIILIGIGIFLFLKPRPVPTEDASRCFLPFLKRKPVLRSLVDAEGTKYEYCFNYVCGIALSFIVGFFSSLFGIGGGIIHVPALIYMFSFPYHVAVASSHFILMISSLIGTVFHGMLGNVEIKPALLIGIGAVLGAQAGAIISPRMSGLWIVRMLSLALIAIGIRLLA